MNTIEIINPANEAQISTVTADTADTIAAKYALLKNGQPGWAATPLTDRLACII